MDSIYMPKLVQCANCKKAFLGTTYTLLKHFEKCILDRPKDIPSTPNHSVHNVTKPKHYYPKPDSLTAILTSKK